MCRLERLTERYEGRVIPRADRPKIDCAKCLERLAEYEDIGCTPEQLKQIDKWYAEMCRELGEYKRLEEQGLMIKLPCKVGDKAYYVHKGGIDEVEVDSFIVNVNLFVNVSLYIGCDRFGKTLTPYKTLFFTKEEAEQALKQIGE